MTTKRLIVESILNRNKSNSSGLIPETSTLTLACEESIQRSIEKFDASNDSIDRKQIELIRSKSDPFDYRIVRLHNGLQIVLISDLSTKSTIIDNHQDDFQRFSSDENLCGPGKSMQIDNIELIDSIQSIKQEPQNQSNGNHIENIIEKLSALIVAVKVGSFDDPPEVQGMAHLLEHLITMGSEKYPGEDAIDSFLSSRGGFQNAETNLTSTIFEVEVKREFLRQAIDMMGHALHKPLLSEDSILKELKPINQEFIEASGSDPERLEVLLSHLAKRNHPLSKFSWGNENSLTQYTKCNNLNLRDLVWDFFIKHYRPENIVVVVQSQDTLDDLEDWATESYSMIESRDLTKSKLQSMRTNKEKRSNLSNPFSNGRFNRLFYVEGVDSQQNFIITWCLPTSKDQYVTDPISFWSALLNEEGKGSLIYTLRKQNLAINLQANLDKDDFEQNAFYSMFKIDIDLTEKGCKKINEIFHLVFDYIDEIRKIGAKQWYFDQLYRIELNTFNYQFTKTSIDYAMMVAKNFLTYSAIDHLLTGCNLFYNFDAKKFDNFFGELVLEKANFILMQDELLDDFEVHHEPWMDVKYQCVSLPSSWLNRSKNHKKDSSKLFHYPNENRFEVQRFELISSKIALSSSDRQMEHPELLISTSLLALWHQTDFKFSTHMAFINVHLFLPFQKNLAENHAMNLILSEYCSILCSEKFYDAYRARYSVTFESSPQGLIVSLKGFSEHLVDLALLVLRMMIDLRIETNRLKSIQNDLVQTLTDDVQDPETFCDQIISHCTIENYFTSMNLSKHVESMTKKKLIDYKNSMFADVSFEILVQGNLDKTDSRRLAEKIEEISHWKQNNSNRNHSSTRSSPFEQSKLNVCQLPKGLNRLRTINSCETNKTSHIQLHQQIDRYNPESCCFQTLLACMMDPLCFTAFRTEQGLGYNVGCYASNRFGILSLDFYISTNADDFDCATIESSILEFIEKDAKEFILSKLDQIEFDRYRKSSISQLVADFRIECDLERNWQQISTLNRDFCFITNEIDFLKNQANLDRFRQWVCDKFFLPSNQKRLLCVQIVGNGEKALSKCLQTNFRPIDVELIHEKMDSNRLQLLVDKIDRVNYIKNLKNFQKSLQFYPR
ncbi:ELAV-like protein 2 [Sarcoptes scabiei]|nr:ELAV-like protein 2 [Sarcoptes scabiei]